MAPKGSEITHPGSPAVLKGHTVLQKLTDKKLIYIPKEYPGLLVKIIQVSEKDSKESILKEIELQTRAYMNPVLKSRVPKVYDVSWFTQDGIETVYILMSRLQGETIADKFGETAEEVTAGAKNYDVDIWKQVRSIVKELRKMGILYYDITGYNFMYYKGFITVLDFGHAEKEESFGHPKKDKIMKYINEFLAGKNEWFSWE